MLKVLLIGEIKELTPTKLGSTPKMSRLFATSSVFESILGTSDNIIDTSSVSSFAH